MWNDISNDYHEYEQRDEIHVTTRVTAVLPGLPCREPREEIKEIITMQSLEDLLARLSETIRTTPSHGDRAPAGAADAPAPGGSPEDLSRDRAHGGLADPAAASLAPAPGAGGGLRGDQAAAAPHDGAALADSGEKIESLIQALWRMRDHVALLRQEFAPYAAIPAARPGSHAQEVSAATPGSAEEVLMRAGLIERAIADVVAVLAERTMPPARTGDAADYLGRVESQKAELLKKAASAVAYLRIHSLQLTQCVAACRAHREAANAAIARARTGS